MNQLIRIYELKNTAASFSHRTDISVRHYKISNQDVDIVFHVSAKSMSIKHLKKGEETMRLKKGVRRWG